VIHGHNGTGKSSLAESIELVMTGTAERLKNKPHLGQIIWPGSKKPATQITLNYSDGRRAAVFKIEEGLAPSPLAGDMSGDSFRLDQTLMDRLARMDPARRAETFLSAYFPGQRPIFQEAAEARARVESIVLQLPSAIRKDLESLETKDTTIESLLISRFKWTEETSAIVPRDAQLACLPLPADLLRGLAPLNKTLTDTINNLTGKEMPLTALTSELDRLDAILKPIADNASQTLNTIGIAKDALTRIRSWKPSPTPTSQTGDFATQLDEWLELEALSDLGTRHLSTGQTLADAIEKGWAAQPWVSFSNAISGRENLAKQRERLKEWTERRDYLLEIMASRSTQTPSEGAHADEPASISPKELSALDKIGEWFFETTSENGLGRTIDDALRKRKAMTFGTLTVGGTEWTSSILDRVGSFEKTVNEFWQRVQAKLLFGIDLLNLYKTAPVAARASESKGAEMSRIFQEQISGKLNAAINELMAVFAPARWAYKGVAIEQNINTGKPELNLRTDGADATLRLNTAELNLFTLALFVLCALSQQNPLQLLVLDDPLQNMDELTVTTLARGLARLIRLMPQGWNLVFLFHGEDDLERFRRELPCTVYRLPWLSPSADEPHPIQIDGDTFPDCEVQDLSKVFSEWTRAAASL